MNFSALVLRGTAAAQPAATSVPIGTLYYQTDTFFIQRSNGTTWDAYSSVVLVGDSGSGGTRGLVPAPSAGDAAAGKFLKADATWSVPAASGKIAQIVKTESGAVATGTTQIPLDDTIPQNTEGDQYLTQAITPLSVTNILKIDIFALFSPSVQAWLTAAIFQDTTAGALGAFPAFQTTGGGSLAIAFSHFLVAGSLSATTFKLRAGLDRAGTTTFNGTGGSRKLGGVLASSICITEYSP